MNCKDSAEMIESYLINGIDPMQDKHLADHINSCPKCRDELAFLKKYRIIMKKVSPVSPPENFMSELYNKIETENKKSLLRKISVKWNSFRSSLHFPLEAAGALAVAVIVLVVYRPFFDEKTADITVSRTVKSPRSHTVQKKDTVEKVKQAKEVQLKVEKTDDNIEINHDKADLNDNNQEVQLDSLPPVVKSKNVEKQREVDVINDFASSEGEKNLMMKKRKSSSAESMLWESESVEKKDSSSGKNTVIERIFSENNVVIIKKDLSGEGRVYYRVKIDKAGYAIVLNKLREKYSVEQKIISKSDTEYEIELFIGDK